MKTEQLTSVLASVCIINAREGPPPFLGLGSESHTKNKVRMEKQKHFPHSSFLFKQESEFLLPPSLFIFLTLFDFLHILPSKWFDQNIIASNKYNCYIYVSENCLSSNPLKQQLILDLSSFLNLSCKVEVKLSIKLWES